MDDSGKYHEEDMFDIIRSSQNQENEPDDGSQFLNDSSEGLEQEPRDEGQTNNDGKENVRQLTKSDEVYIYIKPLVIIRCIN
jgi:hypothetical protein